jgi:hypothetical protein
MKGNIEMYDESRSGEDEKENGNLNMMIVLVGRSTQ